MERLRPDYAPPEAEHPGDFPYTRGISAEPKPWVMGQYAGFGSAADSNKRFRALLDAGLTGFSVALDLPTQLGLDSDDPRAAGEVGRVGVAIDSLADIETLMDGIPLEAIAQVRTTANSIGYLWAALFVALAEKRGCDPGAFGMFIQNDVLKEFVARGTQIFPPEPSLRLSVDVMEHVARHVPRWVPLAMSGYHIRESGADAAQEVAFTFANARAYLDEARAPGPVGRRRRADAVHLPLGDDGLPARGGEAARRAAGVGAADARAVRRRTLARSSCGSSRSRPARRSRPSSR
jgi:methylmalonyl-CoA mutase N-terminal domain/subunit